MDGYLDSEGGRSARLFWDGYFDLELTVPARGYLCPGGRSTRVVGGGYLFFNLEGRSAQREMVQDRYRRCIASQRKPRTENFGCDSCHWHPYETLVDYISL